MELTKESRKKILKYLLSVEVLKVEGPKAVLKHLSNLEHWEQFDAEEDINGDLVYAWAWWMVTDKALEDLKKGKIVKRHNRGKNMVGFFALIPDSGLSISRIRRLIKCAIRMEKAKTFSVFTPKGKWFSIKTKHFVDQPLRPMKLRRARQALQILEGGQQPCLH